MEDSCDACGKKELDTSARKEREPGEYSYRDFAVEGDLAYHFLCNCQRKELVKEVRRRNNTNIPKVFVI